MSIFDSRDDAAADDEDDGAADVSTPLFLFLLLFSVLSFPQQRVPSPSNASRAISHPRSRCILFSPADANLLITAFHDVSGMSVETDIATLHTHTHTQPPLFYFVHRGLLFPNGFLRPLPELKLCLKISASKSSNRERGLPQNPAREREELFKIQQEKERSYSKSSKRKRSYSKSSKKQSSERRTVEQRESLSGARAGRVREHEILFLGLSVLSLVCV